MPDREKIPYEQKGVKDIVDEIHIHLNDLNHTVKNLEKILGVPLVRVRP
jgi:hypothetical protein